jgi:uncharacterized cofD-like protein
MTDPDGELVEGGPRVVALGGGHGLATTLRAARRYAGDLTAIVSVADDGGSSGRLRAAFDVPAPGDLRRCLVALGDPSSLWTQAFEHRFQAGELEGHALGNLVIAGLASATGDFIGALEEARRLVGGVGRVLPATSVPVVLKADAEDGEIEGQVRVASARRISAVSLVPPDAAPPREALEAIARAEQVVIGPGSLFTSLVAVVAVPAIRAALADTSARKVYVANLGEQQPEGAGFDVASHVDALAAHGLDVDVVVWDPTTLPLGTLAGPDVIEAAVAGPDGWSHDAAKLAVTLRDLVG